MAIQKFTICKDDSLYLAWPDVTLTKSGHLVCVFSECIHHLDRTYTRIMLTESYDRGRTWTQKHPLTEGTQGEKYFYNCARITTLSDGRLAVTVDKALLPLGKREEESIIYIYFSEDQGKTWSHPVETPLRGIVPDKLTVTDNGRWLIAAHRPFNGVLTEYLHYSDDLGRTWSPAVTAAYDPRFNLCEGSLLHTGNGVLVMFLRENSSQGWDCKKTISKDNGETWGAVTDFPLPGCHRPSSGFLSNGNILITYRMMQGGLRKFGDCQNLFAGITDLQSVLSEERSGASSRILPLDYDRSPYADTGYSGWVQFPDGEIYVVNYIADDHYDKTQIRGYSLTLDDFMYEKNSCALTF